MSITFKGYDGILFNLVVETTGKHVGKGDTIKYYTHHDTEKEIEAEITWVEAPHKESSTGFVTTNEGRFYAGVYGLRFVKED